MTKLLPIVENEQTVGYFYDCPGCGMGHALYVQPHRNKKGASWTFNGDRDHPTFSPSILARCDFTNGRPPLVCHSFVTDGQIQFLSDCTHELAGQTVPMIDTDSRL